MKKLFVSVPMRGRTSESIKNSIANMQETAEIVFGEELEVIHNYFNGDNIPCDVNPSIYCLGRAIQKMAEADYFIGIGYSSFKGCNIETEVAENYGIPTFLIPMVKCAFLRDAVEINERAYQTCCDITVCKPTMDA